MTHFLVGGPAPRIGRIAPGSFQTPILPPEVFDPSLVDGAHGWADNPGDIVRAITDEYLAFVTVTPEKSGLFRVTGGAVLQFNQVSPASPTIAISSFLLKIGHGNLPTIDYASATPINVIAQSQAANASSAYGGLVFETTSPLPLGAPVKIGLVLAGGNGELTCPAHSAQVMVMEI